MSQLEQLLEGIRGPDGKVNLERLRELPGVPEDFDCYKPYTLTLFTPIQIGKETTVDKLEWIPPKGKQMRTFDLQNRNLNEMLKLAEALTNAPRRVFDELSIEDCRRVIDIAGLYIIPFLATGERSTPP